MQSLTLNINDQFTLTELRYADRQQCVVLMNHPQIYETTLRVPHPYTAQAFDRFWQLHERMSRKHDDIVNFAIRDTTGQLIGAVGFEHLVVGHRAEIGYWLGQPYWNRGIMTSAVRVATSYAQEHWNLIRIAAHVFDINLGSARVLEKCGFHREGVLQKYFCKQGRFFDALAYALVVSAD